MGFLTSPCVTSACDRPPERCAVILQDRTFTTSQALTVNCINMKQRCIIDESIATFTVLHRRACSRGMFVSDSIGAARTANSFLS